MSYPAVILWLVTTAIASAGVLALLAWKRRQERAFDDFSGQILRVMRDEGSSGRIRLEGKQEALGKLGSAVNALLENIEKRGARLQDREQLFQRLVETVHDAVLVHRKSILFANTRFLAILGTTADKVIGRPLADFVAPEYVELVDQNLRRRLAGEPAAERYEVELAGAQGQTTRVELSSTVIDSAGQPALLLTALEMLPATMATLAPLPPRAQATLDAMGESVITVDKEGRIDYINQAASALLGQAYDQVVGKTFADVAALVDESDRRSLGDPVRKAFATGGRVSVGKRAMLVPSNGAAERSVEIGVSPLRVEGNEVGGVVIVLHDTSELRGLTRQMTYQASHDALDRARQSARIRTAAAGGSRIRPGRRRDACARVLGPRSI